ncbi:MAG: hypothetical protein ACI310_04465 [Bacilli bacterium]
MSSFNDFYNNLSSNGVFFFWIVVFLFLFLIFLSIVLIVKNRKLSKYLKKEQSVVEDSIEETPLVSNIKEEIVLDKVETKVKEELPKEEVKEEQPKIEINQDKKEVNNTNNTNNNGLYKKNVLREMNARSQTSPIHIDREEPKEKEDYTKLANNINTTGIDLGEDSLSPLEMMEDTYEVNDNMKFASDIVERMQEEIKPSNIELTDYEKKQEEEAIISYDELLKVKDKIYNITDDEETDEFIDELKSFRIDLQ